MIFPAENTFKFTGRKMAMQMIHRVHVKSSKCKQSTVVHSDVACNSSVGRSLRQHVTVFLFHGYTYTTDLQCMTLCVYLFFSAENKGDFSTYLLCSESGTLHVVALLFSSLI